MFAYVPVPSHCCVHIDVRAISYCFYHCRTTVTTATVATAIPIPPAAVDAVVVVVVVVVVVLLLLLLVLLLLVLLVVILLVVILLVVILLVAILVAAVVVAAIAAATAAAAEVRHPTWKFKTRLIQIKSQFDGCLFVFCWLVGWLLLFLTLWYQLLLLSLLML